LPYSSADAERVSLIITSCAPPSWMLTKPADHELLPLDAALDAARARHGGKPLVALRFRSPMWINGYTAEILATRGAAALSPATEIFEWSVPIHSGQAFGISGRIAFLATGLALAILVASGFLQWNSRPRAQAKRAADVSGR
jgi:uncharacterized iron-regulated membrane protein